MERTKVEDGTIFMGEKEFTFLMVRLIRNYKFYHNNELPKAIVLPPVGEIEGVPIEREEVQYAISS